LIYLKREEKRGKETIEKFDLDFTNRFFDKFGVNFSRKKSSEVIWTLL